jgi:transcription termination factor 2
MPLRHTTLGTRTLYPHQVTAIEWMQEQERNLDFSGGLLCDEMGLGKTFTAIGLLVNSPVPSTLILGPLAVLAQWVSALLSISSLCPALFVMKNGKWKVTGGNARKGRIFLTNYDKLTHNGATFASHYDRIICDEAHILRNYKSKKYQALQKFYRRFTWCITGTPIVNGIQDLITLSSLINTRINAKTTHYTPAQAEEWMTAHALHRTTNNIRHLIEASLPAPPTVHRHRIPFRTEEEATFYRGIQGRIAAELVHLMAQDHPNMINILSLILRLRQMSVHPQVYIQGMRRTNEAYSRPDWTADSSKFDKIVDILSHDTKNHGYVIFCNFKDEMALLKQRLEREASVMTVLTYDGSLSAEQRTAVVKASEDAMAKQTAIGTHTTEYILDTFCPRMPQLPSDVCNMIDQFKGGNHVVLLAQLQCASAGLNLQHMDRVIFTTPWWTAATMDQAIGRVLRIGQKKQVAIHHIALEEEVEMSMNIDDYMNERVEMKRQLCDLLLQAADHRI